jgi:DNA polymerase III subunit epsilon
MRQIFLDTETTGLSPESGDRIIEIGCIEMVNRRLTQNNKHFYLNPQRPSSPEAVKIHGLTDDFLADKPLFASVAQELIEYLQGADVIIHNAAFDVAFLDAEFERVKAKNTTRIAARVTDTLAMAREMFPGKSNSLDALCKRLDVDNSGRTLHGALLDAGLLADVYIAMTRGQDSLVIDSHHDTSAGPGASAAAVSVNLKGLKLPVIEPTEQERQAHAAWLVHLDKASGGKRVWPEGLA